MHFIPLPAFYLPELIPSILQPHIPISGTPCPALNKIGFFFQVTHKPARQRVCSWITPMLSYGPSLASLGNGLPGNPRSFTRLVLLAAILSLLPRGGASTPSDPRATCSTFTPFPSTWMALVLGKPTTLVRSIPCMRGRVCGRTRFARFVDEISVVVIHSFIHSSPNPITSSPFYSDAHNNTTFSLSPCDGTNASSIQFFFSHHNLQFIFLQKNFHPNL